MSKPAVFAALFGAKRYFRALMVAGLALLVLPVLAGPSAAAAPTYGTNGNPSWAGYSATGGDFRFVESQFVVPRVVCDGAERHLSMWAGLGGKGTSQWLAQVGVQIDCSAKGSAPKYSAFWEVLRGGNESSTPSTKIHLPIAPKDQILANVIYV